MRLNRHSVKAGSVPSSLSIEKEVSISAQRLERSFRVKLSLDLSPRVVKEGMSRGRECLVQSPGFKHQASQVGPLVGRKVLKNLVSTFRSCCSWPFIIRKAAPWWHILFCSNAIFSLTNYIVSVARTSGSMLPKAGAAACREVGCSQGPPPAQPRVKDLNQVWTRVLDGTGHLAPVQVARWVFCGWNEGLPGEEGDMCQRELVSHSFPEQRRLPQARWNRAWRSVCLFKGTSHRGI